MNNTAIWVAIVTLCIAVYHLITVRLLKMRDTHVMRFRSAGMYLIACAIFVGYVLFLGLSSSSSLWNKLLLPSYRPLYIFTIYLVCIPLFGAAYYWMFKINHSYFTFTSPNAVDQVQRVKAKLVQKQLRLVKVRAALENALDSLTRKGPDALIPYNAIERALSAQVIHGLGIKIEPSRGISQRVIVLATNEDYTDCVTLAPSYGPGGTGGIHSFLSVISLGEEIEVFRFPNSRPRNSDDLNGYHAEALARCNESSSKCEKRLATMDSRYPDAWGFFDFFYFSTITQTTVGYGDILPNSTIVRMLVSIQVIVGYFIIAIMINFTFGH
jgi:hypothetical protein